MTVTSLLAMMTEGHDLCLMRMWTDGKATEVCVSMFHDVLTRSVTGVVFHCSFLSTQHMAL